MFMDVDDILQADRVLLLTASQYKYYRLYQQGKGIREIAALCGVSPATVCRTIKTAKKSLDKQREEMAEHGK